MRQPWDEQDEENGSRLMLAKIIASIVSGVPWNAVVPSGDDYMLADQFRQDIETYYHNVYYGD